MDISEIRSLLARNVAETRKAREHGAKCSEASDARLAAINSQLEGMSPGDVILDDEKAAAYSRLVDERSSLLRV